MNRTCPLCTADLSLRRVRRVPAKGESSLLALRWYLECPSCKGALQENQHPYEKAVLPVLGAITALLNIVAYAFGFRASSLISFGSIALIAIGPFVGRSVAVPRNWARYVPYSEPRL